VIHPSLTLRLVEEDLQELTETELTTELQRQSTNEARNLLDLTKAPLIRAKLYRIGEEEHIFLLTIHQIVSDSESLSVLYRELEVLYEAFSTGKPSPLANLAIHYADFAIWQRERLHGEVLGSRLDYWKRQFGGELPVLQLPTDRSRPPIRTYQDARQSLRLSKNLTEALRTQSHQAGVALSITLLAAFKTLLYRYSGQEDIIVGCPMTQRNQADTQGLIGFFTNTLVFHTNLSSVPSFQKLLELVCGVVSEAYSHRGLPFEILVRELLPERDWSHLPLSQVGFFMHDSGNSQFTLPGLNAKQLLTYETHSNFDLALCVREQDEEIQLELVYNGDLFEPVRMAEMLGQFKYLLMQIVEYPDNPIQSYSLVTPKSSQVLPDPRMPIPEPRYEPITMVFASWLKSTTVQQEHAAVRQGGRTWSYSELARCANAVAQVLQSHDIEQGSAVAVSGVRSFGLISCMTGVLLSGCVLLTLDPDLPNSRQKLMLQEGKARCLLYVGSHLDIDEWMRESIEIICIEPDSGRVFDLDKSIPISLESKHLPQVSPKDPAYLFFTSGSTGVPKGVLGWHKGLSHFLNWQRQTFAIGPTDRSAQLTGLSFDVVLRDIFTPLFSGATLCLPTEEERLEPTRLLSWLEREKITMLHTVPSLAQWWLANLSPDVSLQTLRLVFFAGEPLSETLVRRWRDAFPESGEIVNLYGPTETTLAKCYFRVPVDPLPDVQPVGSPLPETQALVFTPDYQLCGIGEPGEIVIRTPFRSLGYINASEENQRRFIMNPFRDDERDLLYYTGDRGCYRPDGSLDILGRLDHQVKLRGVRIELGEIEIVLGQHPAVLQNVIMVREDVPGDKRLVAYVTIKQNKTLTIKDLHRFLKQKLPDTMVPSAFVPLDTMPLTPNGKVDRRALPAPEDQRLELEASYIAPRTEVERTITNIWQDVLHIEKAGIHDNFFELGGHSLLATQFISRLREAFQVELPLRSLFETPTVAELAITIAQRKAEQVDSETLAQMLAELDQLSMDEVKALLATDGFTEEN
jgi:amino acid adenylation domain-containing protein